MGVHAACNRTELYGSWIHVRALLCCTAGLCDACLCVWGRKWKHLHVVALEMPSKVVAGNQARMFVLCSTLKQAGLGGGIS
jgi:hypothetical protein